MPPTNALVGQIYGVRNFGLLAGISLLLQLIGHHLVQPVVGKHVDDALVRDEQQPLDGQARHQQQARADILLPPEPLAAFPETRGIHAEPERGEDAALAPNWVSGSTASGRVS